MAKLWKKYCVFKIIDIPIKELDPNMNMGQTFGKVCWKDDRTPQKTSKMCFYCQKGENQAYFEVPHL